MERLPAALVFDRDSAVRAQIRSALEGRGIVTLGAESSSEATNLLNSQQIELLFVDIESPAPAFAGLMARAAAMSPKPVIIGLVAAGRAAERGKSLDAGIFDLLAKPLCNTMLVSRSERALRQLELLAAVERLRRELQSSAGLRGLVGRSAGMSHVRERIAALSGSERAVWFSGEEGSGRELAARTLHASSHRAAEPFMIIDCRELERSGFDRLRCSLREQPPGALYLAEPAALALDLQDAMRSLIGTLPRNGAEQVALPAPCPRLLSGSRQDPHAAASQSHLLPALRELLAGERLRLPPLRERSEDIALLADYFVSSITSINKLPTMRISSEALELLESYRWPGNVRELRNAMEKAVILAVQGTIRSHDLPRKIRQQAAAEGASGGALAAQEFRQAKMDVIGRFEHAYLGDLMRRFEGNVTAAARHAGMLRSALQRLLRKYALKSSDYRSRPARRQPRPGAGKAVE